MQSKLDNSARDRARRASWFAVGFALVLGMGCGTDAAPAEGGVPGATGTTPTTGAAPDACVACGATMDAGGQVAATTGVGAGTGDTTAAGTGMGMGTGAGTTGPAAGTGTGAGSGTTGTGTGTGTDTGAGTTSDAGGSGMEGAAMDAGGAEPVPLLPPVTSTAEDGPFETVEDLRSGPSRDSGLFRPVELGRDGLRHPVFVWGCGGGSNPASYSDHLNQVASHGFVVIAEVSAIGDDGAPLLEALDWLTAQNDDAQSPLYQKLDLSKVALGGHSIGSVNSFRVADDPRWRTTIHVAGGSLDDVNNPFAPTSGAGGRGLVHPAAMICSESDTFGNVEKTEKDFENATVPVFFTVMQGTEHVGAAREGMPALIAWLRWQLGGEEERRADFLEPGGEFQSGKWVSQTKNW